MNHSEDIVVDLISIFDFRMYCFCRQLRKDYTSTNDAIPFINIIHQEISTVYHLIPPDCTYFLLIALIICTYRCITNFEDVTAFSMDLLDSSIYCSCRRLEEHCLQVCCILKTYLDLLTKKKDRARYKSSKVSTYTAYESLNYRNRRKAILDVNDTSLIAFGLSSFLPYLQIPLSVIYLLLFVNIFLQ